MGGKKRKSSQVEPSGPSEEGHRLPLDDNGESVVSVPRARSRASKKHLQSEDKLVASDLSAKILRAALEQQQEIQTEDADPVAAAFADEAAAASDDYKDSDDDGAFDEFQGFAEDAENSYYGDELEIKKEDEEVLEAFMPKDDRSRQLNLGDLILQKIKERDAAVSSERMPAPKFDDRVIDVYKRVGQLLSMYTSGKIPKQFKLIPYMTHWEDILMLTEPQNWSPNAVFQATRIFSSIMKPEMATRFYKAVLLERVRNDIRNNKRLHFALHQSLKKSLYKAPAFINGILRPLCESGNCTLREAYILGAIIRDVSIPFQHSGAALVKLSMLKYDGKVSYLMKVLLEKNYALPVKVIDALLKHFLRFLDEERIMPVIWHQCLLAFVQRYKNALGKDDRDKVERLIQYQKHRLITPEIRRELRSAKDQEDILMPTASQPVYEDPNDFPEVIIEDHDD